MWRNSDWLDKSGFQVDYDSIVIDWPEKKTRRCAWLGPSAEMQNTEDDGTNARDLQASNGHTHVCPRVYRRCLRAPARPFYTAVPARHNRTFRNSFHYPNTT